MYNFECLVLSMKKIYILFALALLTAQTQAQTVTITDSNFAAWLQFAHPTCMSGNQLDIACAGAALDTAMDISNKNISNIDGIEHFTHLKELNCSGNNIVTLPVFPQSLLRLYCFQNKITTVTMLPNSLEELNCSYNRITSLPLLPNTLVVLKYYDNQMATLPAFPTLLKVLHCGGNLYTSIPSLPQLLEELDCQGLGLQTLPTLPASLKILACPYNELTHLPTLPNGLQKIMAHNNKINVLPTLPTALTELNVGVNELTTLPTLPSSVTYVNCQNNAINSLPAFPTHLTYFYCRENLLSYMPNIPNSVRIFDCSYNPIHCLDFAAGWNHNEPAYFYFDNTEVTCRPTYSLNLETQSLEHYMSFPMCTTGNIAGCGILAVDENALAMNVKIFPNPTSDFLQIESPSTIENVELYDMGGRKVVDAKINATHASLDISYLSGGFYTLKSGSYTTKVVKQ